MVGFSFTHYTSLEFKKFRECLREEPTVKRQTGTHLGKEGRKEWEHRKRINLIRENKKAEGNRWNEIRGRREQQVRKTEGVKGTAGQRQGEVERRRGISHNMGEEREERRGGMQEEFRTKGRK